MPDLEERVAALEAIVAVLTGPEPGFMDRTLVEPLDAPGVLTIRLFHEPTGITVAARDRTEGIRKLRKALAGRARREYDLQEQARRQASREQRESGGRASPPAALQPRVRA